jgi:osmotically-inducible protein OsmY
MKSNKDIQHNVEAELRWNPKIDGTYIAVEVNDGVVALTGFVRSAPGVTNVKN